MNPRFRVVVASDPDHENLVGEVYFDDMIVCVLTQELGFDAMVIDLFVPEGRTSWRFNLAEFEEVVATAKRRLFELRRVS